MTLTEPSMLQGRGIEPTMRTLSTPSPQLRDHDPRVVVLAVGDVSGIDDAVAFLSELPELRCPVVVCPTPETHGALARHFHSEFGQHCETGRWLRDAPVWVVPGGMLATVRQDRWELTAHDAADHDAQVGRLVSSLKACYRSRVLMVCTGRSLDANPFVRLLVQRGATLLETRSRPDRALGDHAPVEEIITHLRADSGHCEKASA